MTRLWLPFTVDDLPAALAFYRDGIGLPVVDGWQRDGEEGVVLAAESGFVELVSPAVPGPAVVAFEVSDVDSVYARLPHGEAPHRYPRGHYGFEVPGPAGVTVMIWRER